MSQQARPAGESKVAPRLPMSTVADLYRAHGLNSIVAADIAMKAIAQLPDGQKPVRTRQSLGVIELHAIIQALQSASDRVQKATAARYSAAKVAAAAAELLKALETAGGRPLIDIQASGISDPAALLTRLRNDVGVMMTIKGGAKARGRPIDGVTVGYLGLLARVYEHGTGKKATAYKYVPKKLKGQVSWGKFIAFAHACFTLAGVKGVTPSSLAKAWFRAKARD
jgi:hypothetical protein